MESYTVLISGASSGFGEAIARKMVSIGDKVVILARRKDRLLALQEELGSACCAVVAGDVCDKELMRKEFLHLNEQGICVDVLVNNAGLALGLEKAHKAQLQDWERMIAVNVNALVSLTHLYLPGMIQRGYGHIVNIGSIAGSYPYPGGNVYGATKAFVKQFSLNLRAELYDQNIRVSNIEPGLAGGSEFSLVRFKGDEQKAQEVYQGVEPLLPEDIAEAVCWVVHLPKHVNVNRLEVMPTHQAPAALNVHRKI